MSNKSLLIEDECAPDSDEYFWQKVKEITGQSQEEFHTVTPANKLLFRRESTTHYVECHIDYPCWELFKKEDQNS